MKDSSNVRAVGAAGVGTVGLAASALVDNADKVEEATGLLERAADTLQYPMVPWVLLALALGGLAWVVMTRRWRLKRVND